MPDGAPPSAANGASRAAIIAVVFAASAVALFAVYSRQGVLYDADGYYHLAVARAYGRDGLFRHLEWARFSIMHEGFGDKELLFHLLLVPFAARPDATQAAFVALALCGAAVAAVLAGAAWRTMGRWSVVVPLVVFGAATDFTMRIGRLRPEVLSLLVVLAAVQLAARRRYVLLGAAAAAYALAYTAFHALLGLCAVWTAWIWWTERRLEWRLLVFPAVGAALGALVHPDFPANLRVWLVQNVTFFVADRAVDVGREILPRTTRDALLLNLGWWAMLVALWRSRVPTGPPAVDTRLRDFTVLATAIFAVLFLLMARFITYVVPLATLAVLRAMEAEGAVVGPWVRVAERVRVPLAVVLGAVVLAIPFDARVAAGRLAESRAFRPEMRADWEAFGRAVPDGAKIAASWSAAEAYTFFAPQGRYLNVLDPVFMVALSPELYRTYLDVFEGREPDVPFVARTRFDSDFFADDGQYPAAKARLSRDPRVEPLYEGVNSLHRFADGRNAPFVLDWSVLPGDAPLPPSLDVLRDPATPRYPRATGERERGIEGYVDGRRVPGVGACAVFARAEEETESATVYVEIAPYGRAEVWVDDARAAVIEHVGRAVLGDGIVLPLAVEPGWRRLTIRTCEAGGQLGFYALVRGVSSAARR